MRSLDDFSQTLNSIGWHHSSNQRNVLHFSLVLCSYLQNHKFGPNYDPEQFMCGPDFFVFQKKTWKPQVLFLTWDLQGFFSDFENVLIPQNLILPSIISWTPRSKIWKKHLENPRYFFLPGIFARFFFWFLKCSNSANPDLT